MKLRLSALLLILFASRSSAQLVITPGAQFVLSGNAQLTLNNSEFVNNGNFVAGNSRVSFSGNANSFISGSQPIQFSEIEINKNNSAVGLSHAINVSQRIFLLPDF